MAKATFKMTGYAILTDRGIELWAHDPSILSKKQQKALGVLQWKSFPVKFVEGVRDEPKSKAEKKTKKTRRPAKEPGIPDTGCFSAE